MWSTHCDMEGGLYVVGPWGRVVRALPSYPLEGAVADPDRRVVDVEQAWASSDQNTNEQFKVSKSSHPEV